MGVSQLMQAEPGRTIERRSGTRAATTPRKLPIASPGTNTRGRTKSITLVIDTRAAALERRAALAAGAVAEVGGWGDPESAGRLVDRERQDGDRREGAAELLAEDDRLRAGDQRPFGHGALAGGDRIRSVEAALERGLRRSDRDAVRAVGREDEDLLVRVPVVP